jgi:hypothetical protein
VKEKKSFRRSRKMRAVIRALDDMQLIPAPDGFHEAVIARLMLGVPVEVEVEEQPHGHRGLLVFAGAAGVGVGVAVGVAAWRHIVGHDRDEKMAAIGSA